MKIFAATICTLALLLVSFAYTNSAQADDLSWVAASNGKIPSRALKGGKEDGHKLYICRAKHNGGVHPGKVVGSNCNIGWGGKEITVNSYEVLTKKTPSLKWISSSAGKIPAGAVVGGGENGGDLYICKVSHNGGVHPGKVVGSNCNIGWGGKEITIGKYKVLTRTVGWVSASGGSIPEGGVVGGGENGGDLYICRAKHNKGLHPGKVVSSNCNIGWGGKEITIGKYEVMVRGGAKLSWVAASGGTIPKRAVLGGKENGKRLAVCRAKHMDGVHPGKVVGSNCNIGWGGKEIIIGSYEVLTAKH